MTTKVKGLIKGLRYISQVFDEDKEKDIQIGFPTDVKHIAHIGWDGPSNDNPGWMKEYKSPGAFQSAPLVPPPRNLKENPHIQWVSEDSNRRSRKASCNSPTKEKPRTSRRHSTRENGSNENKENGTRKTRGMKSRRKKLKEDGGSTLPSTSSDTSSGIVESGHAPEE